jgi:sarcosine oxidase subunit beta
VKFYDESVRLWQDLSQDFDLNLFYSTRGHFTLAHTDSAVRTMRQRAEVNKHFGINGELVSPEEIQACPHMDLTCGGHAPILGALYHAPGSMPVMMQLRGAMVVVRMRGVEIHQQTECWGLRLSIVKSQEYKPHAVKFLHPVLCAVAGFTPRILQMVGLQSPFASIHCRRW